MRATPIPSPGDILSRRTGPVAHYGIALGFDLVLDIVSGGPPRIVSLEKFADGKPVSLRRMDPDDLPTAIARAREIAESEDLYNVITFNCEHLKNFVQSGRRYSETVIVLGLLVGIWILACVRER